MQEDWINDFLKFEAYVISLEFYDNKNLGRQGVSIDRIDNDGNYEEGNLRWANISLQNRNRRNRNDFSGVSYHISSKKYQSTITVNRKQKHLGLRETPEEAYQLRVDYILKNKLEGFEIKLP